MRAAAPHLRIYTIPARLTSPPTWFVGYMETPGVGQVEVNGTLMFS